MPYRWLVAFGLCAVLVMPASRALAATITIDPEENGASRIDVDARDAGWAFDGVDDRAVLTELGDGAVTDTRGATSADTSYSLSSTAFVFDIEHARGPEPLSWAVTGLNLYFRPESDVGYVFSGWYAADDPDGRITRLYVGLKDSETGAIVFENYQDSIATPDEAFLLGLEGGDNDNILAGSLTGTLVGGRTYQLNLAISLRQASSVVDPLSPATASGQVALTFIPEPGTGALVALGLLGLEVRRRARPSVRRRR
jgi:hypothetical protein